MPSQYSKGIHRALIGIVENIELAKGFIAGLEVDTFAAVTRNMTRSTFRRYEP